jgi:large subunit ribosomal protein L23
VDSRQIIIRPIISEKSYQAIDHNRYSFEVHPKATKSHVRDAVEEIFNVRVIGVNTLTMKPKPKRRGVHRGYTRGWKKAVVELAPGNRIEFFGAT